MDGLAGAATRAAKARSEFPTRRAFRPLPQVAINSLRAESQIYRHYGINDPLPFCSSRRLSKSRLAPGASAASVAREAVSAASLTALV
jgi:hypothetical protein